MSNDRSIPARKFTLGLNDSTLFLIATTVLVFGAAVWCAHNPNVEKTDFSLTYVGAQIIHQRLGHDLYDVNLQKQIRDSLFQNPSPLLFEHPPFEALLFSPLAVFPFRTAFLVWALFNASIWLLLIYFLRPHLTWSAEDVGYLALWLLFAPLGVALYQGQSSLVLLAIYSVTFISLKGERELLAGAVLGLGLFKFQFVLPFALIMIFRRKWRFLSGFIITSAFLFTVSLIAVGWAGLIGYVRFISTIGSSPQNESFGSAVDMPTLYGLFYAVFRTRVSHLVLNLIVVGSSILLIMFVAWKWRNGTSSQSFNLMFAASLAAVLASSSHMFTHDFSPLILAMFLAAACVSRQTPYSRLLLFPLILFWTFPVYFLFVAWHCSYLLCPVLLLFSYLAIRVAQEVDVFGTPRRGVVIRAQC